MNSKFNEPDQLIPVSVITGFLGSGKTTLLNKLIKHSAMDRVAVLINEFGEIGLDHLLVESINEDILLLQSGCICCQVKDDLVNTLLDLFDKRRRNEVDTFNRVLIETTGVADPVPVIQVLISDPMVSSRFRLDNVITLVDATLGLTQLQNHDECTKQVALADKLILTKADIANSGELQAITERLEQINPSIQVTTVIKGDIHPDALFENRPLNNRKERRQCDVLKWLGSEHHEHNRRHPHGSSRDTHREGIASISISLEYPIEWDILSDWLDSLIFSRADQILRIKGILNIAGRSKPVVIQGVQHMFFLPSELSEWPSQDRKSSLVFITYNFNPGIIERSLQEFLAFHATMETTNTEDGRCA